MKKYFLTKWITFESLESTHWFILTKCRSICIKVLLLNKNIGKFWFQNDFFLTFYSVFFLAGAITWIKPFRSYLKRKKERVHDCLLFKVGNIWHFQNVIQILFLIHLGKFQFFTQMFIFLVVSVSLKKTYLSYLWTVYRVTKKPWIFNQNMVVIDTKIFWMWIISILFVK